MSPRRLGGGGLGIEPRGVDGGRNGDVRQRRRAAALTGANQQSGRGTCSASIPDQSPGSSGSRRGRARRCRRGAGSATTRLRSRPGASSRPRSEVADNSNGRRQAEARQRFREIADEMDGGSNSSRGRIASNNDHCSPRHPVAGDVDVPPPCQEPEELLDDEALRELRELIATSSTRLMRHPPVRADRGGRGRSRGTSSARSLAARQWFGDRRRGHFRSRLRRRPAS